ncbi:lysozyme [Paraburkholderia caribensis]|uniref:lysozyme n=1 Tax=Paraburkholderia caribensis TaxID=75105 RepID=UPI001CAE4E5D|nr:lysozyme [Paraburkholderia caribensis]CAG9262247.1 Lysozyme [Paraburkholderia caribensis]
MATNGKTLVGIVGVTSAALLYCIVPRFEGLVNHGYLDAGGIPTKCMGDTHDVIVGRTYSSAECSASLEAQLIAHAEPVLRITPQLRGHPNQLAAAVSFAYNIGIGQYGASETARRFRMQDWKGACKAMNESDDGRPQWVSANGVVLPGLVKRRAEERRLCEVGLN